ncbi:disease resistance protein RPV1-like [Telopea speciosissima]|uniref:disease resistance protein RPV1-like n=1 Tax=Telopea speciosissima TaxID=54955 RepID=UPI001CC4F0A3|nr:disease resistance protein RPV1-like [Telopea speciosissima]
MSVKEEESLSSGVAEDSKLKPTTPMAEAEETQQQQLQNTRLKLEKTNISFSIWPSTQHTREAVIKRFIETLSTNSILSKRYGSMPADDASAVAHKIKEEAFSVAVAAAASCKAEDDGIDILQLYMRIKTILNKKINKEIHESTDNKTEENETNPQQLPCDGTRKTAWRFLDAAVTISEIEEVFLHNNIILTFEERHSSSKLIERMAAAHHQAFSSSSSSFTGGSSTTYEVFLSFHGKDVRTKFADHLYQDLVGSGIRTFRDEEELLKGNEIRGELLAAIQQSRISIPIFSINYASSHWCLEELTEISECKRTMNQTVMPIFYEVEPRDVRKQTGEYAKAFDKHQNHFDETTVQKWRDALEEVGKLDGWHSKEHTYEGKLVKEVVKTIWDTLNKRLLLVSKKLVGIQSHIKELLMLLDIESDNRKIVGIQGFGGIGKTTIARAVYNTILSHFQEYAFIENVRENAQKHGIHHLQNKLIKDILKQENQNITDVGTGIRVIQERFCKIKVLIVLDDVDQDIQAKSLAGDREWFGMGSKIIITSRNKDILIAQNADGIYEPNIMAVDDSLELFSHYAFGRDQPLDDYLDLSQDMIKTTGGLPLALQVIGSSLFNKLEKSKWKNMLQKLQKVSDDDVMKRLKISYDGLDVDGKQMFLDTACFFIGLNKDIVCHIWDGCGFSSQVGLYDLCVRSLVTINEEGELGMHDQLRDLGRNIVRQENIDEPGMRTRIWSQEEVLEVLHTQTGTNKVKGLSIDFRDISRSEGLTSEGFATMTRLRLLQVDYAQFCWNFTNSFSELRWLSWKGCPEQYAQTNFCPLKLAVLDLSCSEITKNWMGWKYIKMAENLKVLNLTSCLQLSSTPDVSSNRLLKVLLLKDCRNLDEIDTSICHLTNLVKLDMSDCRRIKDLPSEICKLTSLQKLTLIRCRSLKKLPEKLGRMVSLTELDLGWCESLVDLPNEICQLTSLKKHNLEGCSCLPSSLTSLDVNYCGSIRYISGLPSSLTSLYAEGCNSMVKLSSASGGLRNLKTLTLFDCKSLEEIEGVDNKLDSLEDFKIWECRSLKNLPKLTGSKNLRTLVLSSNDVISDFEGEGMESLEVLEIGFCKSLRKIPYLRDSKRLRKLQINECPELSEIERLQDYESLQELSINRARSLKASPEDISTLKNLSYLGINECCYSMMERFPDLSNLKELRELDIGKQGKLMKFTNLPIENWGSDARI